MGNTNDKISVIIAVYNAEKTLEKSVNSVLEQTYQNLEIILVDDGSTDQSGGMCDLLVKRDSRILTVHKENEGLPYARKTGIEMATGEYLGFVDADDIIDPKMYETMIDLMHQHNVDMVSSLLRKEYSDGSFSTIKTTSKYKVYTNIEAIKDMCDEKNIDASLAPKLIKKELLSDVKFEKDLTIGEDFRTSFFAMAKCNRILFINDMFYHYIQNTDSMCYKGYTGNGKIILKSYTDVKNLICKQYPQIANSAIRYWLLQEMAVIISMIKSNKYDWIIVKSIQADVRRNVRSYLKSENTKLYLKICAVFLSIHPILLILPYKILFSKRFKRKYGILKDE